MRSRARRPAGDGRIYRLAYSEEHYVDMMLHSLPLWHEHPLTQTI